MNPDVPAHLWDNIRANIPSAPPTEAVSGAGQGAAGSSGAGASGLIKLGAAAVVLIGGGILVWQLNTGEVNNALNNSNEIVEQAEPIAPTSGEEETSVQPDTDAAGNQSVDKKSTVEGESIDDQVQEEASDRPEQVTSEESMVAEKSEEAVSAQNASDKAVAGEVDQSTESQNEVSERVQSDVPAEPEKDQVSGSEVQKQPKVQTQNSNAPIPVPLQVVEVGILADEVFGEAPLSIQFSNVTDAKYYEWDFGNGRKSNEASPMPTFDRPGDYIVKLTVTDFEGNRLSDEMEISVIEPSVIYLPDVFTPNGDGLNDYFEVKGTNITEVTFEVFRLDGSLVYTGTDINDKWDGKDRQQPGNGQYMVVTRYVKNDGTPAMEKSMLTVIRE